MARDKENRQDRRPWHRTSRTPSQPSSAELPQECQECWAWRLFRIAKIVGPGTGPQVGSGFLTEWAKTHRAIFFEHTAEQAALIGDIVDRFPSLSGAQKTTPYEADAWLIALSLCADRSWIIVTDESPKPAKLRIPMACQAFGVPWMNGYQLLREEQWRYVRAR